MVVLPEQIGRENCRDTLNNWSSFVLLEADVVLFMRSLVLKLAAG